REKLTEAEKKAGKNPGVDFFGRFNQLVALGLIEWVPHLCESEDPDAEIIHAVGFTFAEYDPSGPLDGSVDQLIDRFATWWNVSTQPTNDCSVPAYSPILNNADHSRLNRRITIEEFFTLTFCVGERNSKPVSDGLRLHIV